MNKRIRHSCICFFPMLLFLAMNIFAFADSIEIATVTAHYQHPVTGVIEDSGANIAIGQGMTESVVYPQALIETDSQGQIYATLRFNLASRIESFKIQVQNTGDTDFGSVHTTEMKRGEDSVDLRFPLSSKDSIARIEAYITAMGRSVIFYAKLGSRISGNTDFVISVNPDAGSAASPETSVETTSADMYANHESIENADSAPEEEAVSRNEDANGSILQKKSAEPDFAFDPNHGLLMKGDPRLGGVKVEKVEAENKTENVSEYGPITLAAIQSVFVAAGVLSVLIFSIGIALAGYFHKLRKTNDLREAELYGFTKKN